MKAITHRILTAGVILAILLGLLPFGALNVQASTSGVVISQVYGGGGNSGATYTHDFVELFNAGAAPVSLAGWSVQYGSATGTGNIGGNSAQLTELPDVTLQPGQYFLVQEASTAAVGAPLPAADVVDATPIAMAAGAGKVALVKSALGLGCNGGSAPCSAAQLALIEDLVGYGNANFFEGAGAAPTLSATTSAQRNSNGCMDTDVNSADFTAAAPAPRNTASPLNPCGGPPVDTAPTVTSTVPANGSTGVALDQVIEVTFSEAVTAGTSAFALSCTGTITPGITVGGGPITYTITPDASFEQGKTCTVTVLTDQVTDQDGDPTTMEADYSFSFTTYREFTPIYEIQGSGDTAAVTGLVTTQGVVVGDYEGPSPALRGFYIQDPAGDGNSASSDGIFVFNGNNNSVALGDLVRVSGTAEEFQGQTQISTVTNITIQGTGTVAPVDVTFPVPSVASLEQFEGMLVRLPQTMVVTEHFQLGRFGQVVISAEERLQQPTNVLEPGPDAAALQDLNNRSKIILDDAQNNQNPDPIIFSRNETALTAENTLRGGDTITGAVGVMTYTWAGNSASGNAYRVRPIEALGGTFDFVAANPRPEAAPETGGRLQVVAMNTLNLFNTWDGLPDNANNCTLGVGGGSTDCRGADTQEEFDRQWPKTVDAILEIDPDVLGVNEIENDGYGPDSAIAFLVNKLNEATAPGTYAFIDADALTGQLNALGTDAIKVGMIYKPATVTPIGQTAALNTVAFVNGGDSAPRSRPSLIQAFTENATGSSFIVSVNHLKSKGSACDIPDAGDGQGNCNIVRLNAVNELLSYLATDPTGTGDPDVLIIGDLNSYAKEDPIRALEAAGYTNLVNAFIGPDAYSYVFDGQWGYLDHALGSPSIVSQVTGVGEYHINADEPSVLDYNTDFKTANLINTLYAPDEFRVSDHDPVIVGLDLNPLAPSSKTITGGGWVLPTTGDYTTGKANFTFDAKYTKNSTTPAGSANLYYEAGNFHFVSTSVDWMRVLGNQAILGGKGTVNGSGEYQFMLWAVDGNPDAFRMRIWSGSEVVYDNGAVQPIGGGKITLHK